VTVAVAAGGAVGEDEGEDGSGLKGSREPRLIVEPLKML